MSIKKSFLPVMILLAVSFLGLAFYTIHNRDFFQEEIVSVDSISHYQHPLLAKTEDGRIRLFAKSCNEYSGVILKTAGQTFNFDWRWRSGGFHLPQVYAEDFDSDGQEEVLCILDLGGGTGISVYQLHMLEITGDNDCKDNIYNSYLVDLADAVSYEVDEISQTVRFFIHNVVAAEVSVADFGTASQLKHIIYSEQVYFSYQDNQILLEVQPGFRYQNSPFPFYKDMYIQATVHYKDGEFNLSHISINLTS